jgi:adenylate kinase
MFKFSQLLDFASRAKDSLVFNFWSRVVWPFSQPTFVVFLGAPGSGKGTHSVEVAKYFGVPQLSTGDVFRREVKNQTPIGRLVMQCMKDGGLAPDHVTFQVVRNELRAWKYRKGAILDGFPRNVPQAEMLARFLRSRGVSLKVIVALEVPEEELLKRLLARGRADDTPEVIKNRMRVYENESGPLVPYYERTGRLLRVSLPGAAREEVLDFILRRL